MEAQDHEIYKQLERQQADWVDVNCPISVDSTQFHDVSTAELHADGEIAL